MNCLHRLTWIAAACLLSVPSPSAFAGVVRFEIDSREVVADGQSFGDAGPYQRITGRIHYAIDPKLPQNQTIVDLQYAPRNADGLVEFVSDLDMLAPKDLSKANGAVLYDVNNRGNKMAMSFLCYGSGNRNEPKTAREMGDGFLLRHGFVVVWSGWNGELLPGNNRLRLRPPKAIADPPLRGPVCCEVVVEEDCQRADVNWGNHGSYRPVAEDLAKATLTVRERARDPKILIPRDEWRLHVTDVESDSPAQLPRVELEVDGGLKRGLIYELIYQAQDPIVHGVCFASVRDLIAAFKHGEGEGNPLMHDGKPAVNRAHGFGVSQSGRFLRELLYSGFNEDEKGRKVFEGLIPHVAGAGFGSFNHRFAQPTRYSSQHDHAYYPTDRFPFAYGPTTDPLTGKKDSVLQRAVQSNTVPYVLHTQASAEYWTRGGSLVHTDPLGRVDVEIPDNVRIYYLGGTQHGPSAYPPRRAAGKYLSNPGDYKPLLRGLLLALDKWVTTGEPVPPSVYPRIDKGTLVDLRQAAKMFPAIPGVEYPSIIRYPELLDFGPRWETEQIMDQQPPRVIAAYPALVAKTGPDGNELDCLLPPEVIVPVATYTGWNLRSKEAGGENEIVSMTGAFLPFPKSEEEKAKTGDPRPSVQGKYGTLDGYIKEFTEACETLRRQGYLLQEDAERLIATHRERVKPLFQSEAK